MTPNSPRDLLVGDDYYILASSLAELPKLVLKHDEAFVVANQHGDLPRLPPSELGFYVEGTRFLRQLELLVLGERPLMLYADVSEDALQASVELTNTDTVLPPHAVLAGRSVRITRRLCVYDNTLYQLVVVESFAHEPIDLTVSFRFSADFVDMFEVRGLPRERRGTLLPPEVDAAGVRLAYRGLDDVVRTTALRFDPAPARLAADAAEYSLSLRPRDPVQISLAVSALPRSDRPARPVPFGDALPRRRAPVERLEQQATAIRSTHNLFDRWIARSRRDLHLLVTETPDGFFPYAGVPWYVAAFGRDALITALQVLPFEPEIAKGTLRFLASHIGTVDDAFTDQEPGKILHEYRRGEMAACREIPFIPYYGSIDATPLYLMLLAEYFDWTGDLAFVHELWPAALSALGWMTAAADAQGAGYLAYQRRSPRGLANQGWKDAFDAVMHANGDLANPPIALAEVQGYQYAALRGMAHLAQVRGAVELAESLTKRSERLRERFETRFLDGRRGVLRHGPRRRGAALLRGHLESGPPALDAPARTGARPHGGGPPHGRRHVHGLGDPDAREPQPGLQSHELPHGLGVAARHGHRRRGHAALRPGRAVPDPDDGAVRGGPAVRSDADARALLRLPASPRIRPDALSRRLLAPGLVRGRRLPACSPP